MSQLGEADTPDLGPCCNCGGTRNVRNVMMLQRRAPVPGTGWGCVICKLPHDGAIAVMCDDCVGKAPMRVCRGYPNKRERVAFDDLAPDVFKHDPMRHMDDFPVP